MKLEIGNSVVVKKGVVDPDSERFSLEGWQGRILIIDNRTNPEHSLITVEWDSITRLIRSCGVSFSCGFSNC